MLYRASTLLDSFVTGCGWDLSDNAPIDDSSAPPSAKQLLSVFEQAYKDTLKFCGDAAKDLVSRAHDLVEKMSADTADMVKLATRAVQLMKGKAEAANRMYLIEESSVMIVLLFR